MVCRYCKSLLSYNFSTPITSNQFSFPLLGCYRDKTIIFSFHLIDDKPGGLEWKKYQIPTLSAGIGLVFYFIAGLFIFCPFVKLIASRCHQIIESIQVNNRAETIYY